MKYSVYAGAVRWSGGTMILERGKSIEDDHPFAVERPDLFSDTPPGATIAAPPQRRVERATAAPGEQRGPAPRGRGKAGGKTGE